MNSGHNAIIALGWYLDRQVPVDNATHWFWLDTWADMYSVNPSPFRVSDTLNMISGATGKIVGKVLGGEANMWSEQVSALSLDTRV